MSEQLFVHTMRLEFAEVLGDTATIEEIMVFVAIACLESDYGRSRLAREQHNYFGMKSPKKRPTTNLDFSKVFATYASRRSCVIDFVCWLAMQRNMFRYSWQNSLEIIDYLVDDCGYCPDDGYKEKLIAVHRKIRHF